MSVISQPDVTVNIIAANTLVENTAQKVLFVGQQTSVGSAVSGDLETGIPNDNSWDNLYGENSILATMLRDARKLNKDVRFDAIGLDDAGTAVAAAGDFTITGSATGSGTLTFIVGSKRNHSYKIGVAVGDSPTVIGDALVAAILADSKTPVSSANTTGVVALTAINLGTLGNTIGLKIEGSVAGVAYTLTLMAGGTTDPVLTNVFDVIGDERYQTIVWPFTNDIDTLKIFLDARFNTSNDIQDGVGIVSIDDTVANLTALLTVENSQSIVINVDKKEAIAGQYFGSSILELGYSKSAQIGAIKGLRLEDGTDVSQFVITRNGARDSFGGAALASKPYFNTPMPLFTLIDIGNGFSKQEIETLHDLGGFVIGNNRARNASIMGELVTTYKTDVAGNPDISFKYLNYVDTISNIREYYFNNLKARFAQSRLTEGALIRGRDMANQELIEAFCTQLHTELSGEDFVLTQAGEVALKYYIKNLVVTLDLATGTVTINMLSPIVTQLRTILATVQISFSVNG